MADDSVYAPRQKRQAVWNPEGKTALQVREHEKYIKRQELLAIRYREDHAYREQKLERQRIRRASATPEERAASLLDLKEWAQANPEMYVETKRKATFKHRLKKYGMTIDGYESMLRAQNYKCASCGSESTGQKRNGNDGQKSTKGWPSISGTAAEKDWHIDHDHESGKVRALLCHKCNTTLGFVRDDVSHLMALVEYLKKHKT